MCGDSHVLVQTVRSHYSLLIAEYHAEIIEKEREERKEKPWPQTCCVYSEKHALALSWKTSHIDENIVFMKWPIQEVALCSNYCFRINENMKVLYASSIKVLSRTLEL